MWRIRASRPVTFQLGCSVSRSATASRSSDSTISNGTPISAATTSSVLSPVQQKSKWCFSRTGIAAGHSTAIGLIVLEPGSVIRVEFIRIVLENRDSATTTSVTLNVTNRLLQNRQFTVRFELLVTEIIQ